MNSEDQNKSPQHQFFQIRPELQSSLQRASQVISSMARRFEDAVPRIDVDLLKRISELCLRLYEANKERAEAYPRLAQNMEEIARRGWFISLHTDLASFEELAFYIESIPDDETGIDAIDQVFSKHYSDGIEYFMSEVLKKYPDREFAIRPAVNAHHRGEYALSVPIFFSQAEGILRDETKKELFTKRDNIASYAGEQRKEVQEAEDFFNYFDDAIWAPLCGDLPIAWGPSERKKHEYAGLNRNTILHGLDKNYASEVNSLKAFSLLSYVAGLFD